MGELESFWEAYQCFEGEVLLEIAADRFLISQNDIVQGDRGKVDGEEG